MLAVATGMGTDGDPAGGPGAGDDASGSDAAFDAALVADDVRFGGRDAALLSAVDESGSLNRAADRLGRSFAHAQRRVVALEEAFGPLVERRRGGRGGGGSELTPTGRDLLARFERLRREYAGVARADQTVLRGRVVDRDGELATVETGAGPVRALVPGDATDVEVWMRSDAVTVAAPADAPAPEGTSARNRFPGTVVGVERGAAIAKVAVDAGAGTPLSALVTLDSVEKLGLAPGEDVVVSWKATATRARDVDAGREGEADVGRDENGEQDDTDRHT